MSTEIKEPTNQEAAMKTDHFSAFRIPEKSSYEIHWMGHGLVASAFFGSGMLADLDGDPDAVIFSDETIAEEYTDFVDQVVEQAQKEEFLLSQATRDTVQEIIQLRAKLKEATDKLTKQLSNATSTFDPESFWDNPAEDVGEHSIVTGTPATTVKGRQALRVHGQKTATLESDGCYVHQEVGCCEDDYSGDIYLRLEKGTDGNPDKFLRLPYEC